MSVNDRHTATAFLAGVTVCALFFLQLEYGELAMGVILLWCFRGPLVRLVLQVHADLEAYRLERRLAESVHFEADPRLAYEFFRRK